ncbi:hypothetical protein IIA16_02955, partial [bacterium]|nr:hypothetical protein [bacterium]
NLTMLAAAEKEVRRQGGEVDLDTLADGDKKTFALLSRGESEGIFQMEAGNAVRLLRAIKPREIEDLAIINALIRPGPVNSGLTDRYVRRRQGKEKPEPPHPALQSVLADTLGVMIYQEQVMEMAREIAGFSLVEADDLRKAMGKKIKSLMAAQRERFITGCEKVGKVNAREAKALFDEVAEFAQYGFNKAHAVAYSVIGYQAAWLKAHWPAQFHAAWLSSFGGNAAEVGGFVARLVGNGVSILPPDVNKSLAAFSVEDKGVRYGLASVRHVGEGAAEALVAERTEAGPFTDLGDFALRVSGKVNRRAAESLAAAGAFASMGLDRRELQVVMEEVFKEAEASASMRGQAMLFTDAPLVRLRTPSPAEVALVPPDEVLEFGALEAFLTTSPMGAKGERFRAMGLPSIAEAAKKGGKAAVAGFLSGAKVHKGYGGRKRAEGYLQDRTCRVEWVMYEESLGRVPMEALADGIVVLEGSFRSRRGAERFVAEALYPGGEGYVAARRAVAGPAGTPAAAPETPHRPPLVLGVPESLDEESLGALARLVRTLEPGPLQVILEFPGAKRYRLSHSFTPEAKESLIAWRAALRPGGSPPPS